MNQPFTFLSHSPDDTRRFAAELAERLPKHAVLALHGELGSGKTCFVQGLALALGIRSPITSPTFTIISEYRGTRPFFHLDFYRLRTPQEILALGLDEYLEAEGIKAIEWAERADDLLPPDTWHVYLRSLENPDEREIMIVPPRCRRNEGAHFTSPKVADTPHETTESAAST